MESVSHHPACGARMLDKELVDILACPSCRAPVSQEKDEIVCRACGRRYPIRDGIAVMLVEEARVGKGNPDS